MTPSTLCRRADAVEAMPPRCHWRRDTAAPRPTLCRPDAVDVVPPRRRHHAASAQVNAKRCLGNAWVARNDIPRAIRRYGAAIEIGDSDYDITDEDEKRRLREAVAACKLNRAMCHLKVKNYADCLKDCSDVLDIDPSSVKALFRQGKCYLALDKWDAAKESFRKVLELDDGNMEARRGLQSVRVSVCVKINVASMA